ncbi:MAG TPA: hypothetical protein VMU81_06550 [Acetobacteraceae bacterium]|jgi:hypothetical protein|nr:hypothetical protein [Acetobacteraceae bacterium]
MIDDRSSGLAHDLAQHRAEPEDGVLQRLLDALEMAHLYDRVRDFLVRRHKMPARSIGPFRMDAVFGESGVLRPRLCRRSGAMS